MYRMRDSSLLESVLCGVHAALFWSLSALLVLFVVPLLSFDFSFSSRHVCYFFWKNKQNAYVRERPSYLPHKTQGARDSLHFTALLSLSSSHSRVDASAGHGALDGLPLRSVINDQNTTTTTLPRLRLLLPRPPR